MPWSLRTILNGSHDRDVPGQRARRRGVSSGPPRGAWAGATEGRRCRPCLGSSAAGSGYYLDEVDSHGGGYQVAVRTPVNTRRWRFPNAPKGHNTTAQGNALGLVATVINAAFHPNGRPSPPPALPAVATADRSKIRAVRVASPRTQGVALGCLVTPLRGTGDLRDRLGLSGFTRSRFRLVGDHLPRRDNMQTRRDGNGR